MRSDLKKKPPFFFACIFMRRIKIDGGGGEGGVSLKGVGVKIRSLFAFLIAGQKEFAVH